MPPAPMPRHSPMGSPGTRSTSSSWWRCWCGRVSGWRWRERSHRLPSLEQHAADDFETAVGLLLQRIERFPGLAVLIDDVDALGDLTVGRLRLAELKALVAIDRRVGVLDHQHENVGLRKHHADAGRGIGIGRGGVVAAERLFLCADHALRIGDVVRASGEGEAEQGYDKQKNGPHAKGSVA